MTTTQARVAAAAPVHVPLRHRIELHQRWLLLQARINYRARGPLMRALRNPHHQLSLIAERYA